MPRAARRVVRHQPVRLLAEGLYLALARYLPAAIVHQLVDTCGRLFRQRLFPPLITLWGMVSQALSDNLSDRAAVDRLAAYFGLDASPRSGAYCRARQRLPLALLKRAAKHVADNAPQHLAHLPGRRVYVLDGCHLTLADTPQNQALYPQPKAQKPGCGFPVLQFVALLDHATGCLVDLLWDSLAIHEARLARPLWDRLKPGDILLADRGFSSYGLLAALKARGVDVVIRQHHLRKNSAPSTGPLDDRWETWTRPRSIPPWWRAALPPSLSVRVVRYSLPNGQTLILNTFLDENQYPAKTLCDLYHTRWRIETVFGDLKTTLGLDSVYPKRPQTAQQLLWAHALAYNLVCCLLLDVSLVYGVSRSRLSFKAAADALAAGLALIVTAAIEVWAWVAERIARDLLPDRPDRVEPRVLKRRPKQYPLLTQPRAQLRLQNIRGKPK